MERRADILRNMQICRFCLDDNETLASIYERDKDSKQTVPLPLQIMACVAIEVFANDGMPQMICKTCRTQTQQAYIFKTTCKKSDDALKLYLATGKLIKQSRSTTFDENVEKPAQKKRPNEEDAEVEAKKTKVTKSPEMIMITYSDPLEVESDVVTVETTELITGSKSEDELEEEETDQDSPEEDEENKINPVLKVPQVKTDVFPCPHCERSFPLQQLLDIHQKNHDRERSFGCEECGRKFFTKYDLGKHIQTHSDNKPFECVVCNKNFSRESLLHRHEKIHTDVPKYLCTTCDKTFLTREDLDVHSEKHKKKRPFACRLCNKSFVFKQGLERHELSHADQKPHKCNYCEASFTSPIKLTRHITSHAGLRPYPCKLCGRTFLLSHHLTRHMRSHYAHASPTVQPVGQHKCDVCSMSFRRKDSLINHSAIHSMVNLKCVICNTAFETARMVKEHITTHLAGLPYPCDKCDYSFETQEQLEEHELKHAEMEYEEQIEREVNEEALNEGGLDDEDDDEDDEYSGDDIAEFTITNTENPEVVRRSKRSSKIKNYAQFLKDELGSDLEDEAVECETTPEEQIPQKPLSPDESIKPVVRTEGTKVYTRKNFPDRPKPPIVKPIPTATPEQINEPPSRTFGNLGLTKQAVNSLPNRTFVDMKIGDKTVRVQKLMMTKAEIEAMAKEGKIEMKGSTILLNKSKSLQKPREDRPQLKLLNVDSASSERRFGSVAQSAGKKSYLKKVAPDEARTSSDGSNIRENVLHRTGDSDCETVVKVESNSSDV